jgi:hypothetical protein
MGNLRWLYCLLLLLGCASCGPIPDSLFYCLDNKTLPLPLPISTAPPCLSIKNRGCLDLTLEFTLGNKTIFGPKDIPLKFILQSQEREICQTTSMLPGVEFCGNVTNMTYIEAKKTLNVCITMSAQFKIMGIPGPSKLVPLPCFDIPNCEFPKTCLNGCNGYGACELGVCRCYPGRFGMDCGAKLEKNCILQGNTSTCWNITEPTCRRIDVEVFENNKSKEHLQRLVNTNAAIDIQFPCKRNISDAVECVDCISLHDVLVVGDSLKGAPAVSLTCGGIPVHTQKFPLTTLVQNLQTCHTPVSPPVVPPPSVPTSSPVAPPTTVPSAPPKTQPSPPPVDPPTDDGGIWDKAKENKGAVIIGAVVILVILIALIGVGFYLYKRCSKQAKSGSYQTVSSVDPFDGTPMQDDADAINYSFSQSTDEDD